MEYKSECAAAEEWQRAQEGRRAGAGVLTRHRLDTTQSGSGVRYEPHSHDQTALTAPLLKTETRQKKRPGAEYGTWSKF